MKNRLFNNDRNIAKLFLAPSFVIILLLNIYPIFNVFFISFQDRGLFDLTSSFVGIKNYLIILKDPNFINAFKNSIIWTIGTTSTELIFGTFIALLLNMDFKFRNIARGLLLVSYVIPNIVSTLVFKYLLNDVIGLANYILNVLNITKIPIAFLSNPKWAMVIVILINSWHYYPFVVISVLAALQNVNPDMYDAANVDGANNFQKFRYITIPTIAPVLIIVTLLRTIWNFQKFDTIYLMTKGGPLSATTTIPILIYNQAFRAYNISRAASYAIIIFLILLLISILYINLFEKAEKRVVE